MVGPSSSQQDVRSKRTVGKKSGGLDAEGLCFWKGKRVLVGSRWLWDPLFCGLLVSDLVVDWDTIR